MRFGASDSVVQAAESRTVLCSSIDYGTGVLIASTDGVSPHHPSGKLVVNCNQSIHVSPVQSGDSNKKV